VVCVCAMQVGLVRWGCVATGAYDSTDSCPLGLHPNTCTLQGQTEGRTQRLRTTRGLDSYG